MKMISPSNREVDVGRTLSETEYIGMCRREVMDDFLRKRAEKLGATVINGLMMKMEQQGEQYSTRTFIITTTRVFSDHYGHTPSPVPRAPMPHPSYSQLTPPPSPPSKGTALLLSISAMVVSFLPCWCGMAIGLQVRLYIHLLGSISLAFHLASTGLYVVGCVIPAASALACAMQKARQIAEQPLVPPALPSSHPPIWQLEGRND